MNKGKIEKKKKIQKNFKLKEINKNELYVKTKYQSMIIQQFDENKITNLPTVGYCSSQTRWKIVCRYSNNILITLFLSLWNNFQLMPNVFELMI